MNIFFIYDTTYCNVDKDDPNDAIIYFFPTQAFENRHSLCCQLVGVTKFLKSAFSSPSVIAFDDGKFTFQWIGKYLLVLGGNTDLHNNVIKKQLSFLIGIFCFYHGSMDELLKECKNDRKQFLAKLEIAWSRYVTLMHCFDNLLHLPLHPLPLSSSTKHINVVLKANRLLQTCQLNPSVVAGAVFCNSRILSSQFTPETSSYLTLMSNTNASAPVSNVTNIVNLPPDVELKYVYMSHKTFANTLKYNHMYVGNYFRMKKDAFKVTTSSVINVTSGSEGDVDSGNCSETTKDYDKRNQNLLQFNHVYEKYLLKRLSCCAFHAHAFKKSMVLDNQTDLKFLKRGSTAFNFSEHEEFGIHSQNQKNNFNQFRNETCNCQASSRHLICQNHAYLLADRFVLNHSVRHNNLLSVQDLDFACFLCTLNHNSFTSSQMSKKWNTEVILSDASKLIERDYAYRTDEAQPPSAHEMHKSKKLKIQVLKCRNKISNFSKVKHNHQHPRRFFSESSSLKNTSLRKDEFPESLSGHLSTSEKENFEKMILFVQRCGVCTLLLLLKKKCDDKTLNYLWNCGFSVLKDLEQETDKMLENYTHKSANSYLLLYNNVHKILREYPCYANTKFSEKLFKNSTRALQEDLVSSPNLQFICLLSSQFGLCACHTQEHSAFFLQHDPNIRKMESLINFNNKAVKKFEKYLKISL